MNKQILIPLGLFIGLILIVLGILALISDEPVLSPPGGETALLEGADAEFTPPTQNGLDQSADDLSAEAAEIVGFTFINDFVALAPPSSDPGAAERAYAALSSAAQQQVAPQTISRDMAMFVGVQDVPDMGVSVENLIMEEDGSATLVVGLNFSGGPTWRRVSLVPEGGVWKVDSITFSETKD